LPTVSAVSPIDFRASPSQPGPSGPEGDDPFAQLLHSIANEKADAARLDSPRGPERRADAPAKAPKHETDTERRAKRHGPETEQPEGAAQPEDANATPQTPETVTADEDETSASDDTVEIVPVDALFVAVLNEQQQPPAEIGTAPTADAEQPATTTAVPAINAVNAESDAPALVPALGPAINAAGVTAAPETQTAEPAIAEPEQKPAKISVQLEITPKGTAPKTHELALPQAAAEQILSRAKPAQSAAQFVAGLETQPQTPAPAPASATASVTPASAPSPLETLNAAISRHMQLALAADQGDAKPDAPKPILSSNAAAPNFAMTAQLHAPAQLSPLQAADAPRAVPLEQLAVEIATRAGKGERRFDIRLDPPELGRIDVRLEIDSKGNTTTKLIVERAETLDLMQRDARGLEKALQNAGLKLDSGGLQFSLQQDAQTQQGQQNHAPELRGRAHSDPAATEVVAEIAAGNASLAAQLRGGVDIRI
jgi:flagellar hook-length control protein FliK